jgi:hypothetical protein
LAESVTITIEGGRITSGHEEMAAALAGRQAVEAVADGEKVTLLPLKREGEQYTAARFHEFVVDVLATEDAVRCFLEGVDAYHAGGQFHEGPYAKPGGDVGDDEYQRGYEWRKGWNEAALGRA